MSCRFLRHHSQRPPSGPSGRASGLWLGTAGLLPFATAVSSAVRSIDRPEDPQDRRPERLTSGAGSPVHTRWAGTVPVTRITASNDFGGRVTLARTAAPSGHAKPRASSSSVGLPASIVLPRRQQRLGYASSTLTGRATASAVRSASR